MNFDAIKAGFFRIFSTFAEIGNDVFNLFFSQNFWSLIIEVALGCR